MKAALELLAQTDGQHRRIAVVGDMLELGPGTVDMHAEVGAFLAQQAVDYLIACGPLARSLAEGARRARMDPARIMEVPDATSAAEAVKAVVRMGDVVLVKASRGMKLEHVVAALQGARRTAKKASRETMSTARLTAGM
jgi:UDP-N-acetylmuramoyl-tripeptide--D-alanyl-D-alanine ligase